MLGAAADTTPAHAHRNRADSDRRFGRSNPHADLAPGRPLSVRDNRQVKPIERHSDGSSKRDGLD